MSQLAQSVTPAALGDVEKTAQTSLSDVTSTNSQEKSRGIRRVEIISSQYGKVGKFVVFFCLFLVGYSYGLDSSVRYQFQSFAQSSYGTHSLIATINIATSVIAVAAQPFYARLSDVFGRAELLSICILFYVVGTILESQARNASIYAGGAVIFQFGYTGILLMVQLLCGDFSLLNWRLLASLIPVTPFIINTWISGNLVSAVGSKWSWGIAMWAIIFPVVCTPLMLCLTHMHYRASKSGQLAELRNEDSHYKRLGLYGFLKYLFFKLDIVGLFLLVAVLALILVPFTLAGGVTAEWGKAKIIAPLCVGFCLIPVFIYWENYTKTPFIPFHLLKDRGVWAALGVGSMSSWIWYMQGDYMFTVLVVAVNESFTSATRINSLYSFVSVLTGTIFGFVVAKVRYLKPFIVGSALIWFVSMGMLIHFRGGTSSRDGIIAALCLMGFGAGFLTYPAQSSIQSNTNHENMAVVTSLYFSSFYIGSALGNTISGAIWTQVLPSKISAEFTQFSNSTLVKYAYGSPFEFVVDYPWGTPERDALVIAYQHVQRLLLITGTCLCIPFLIFALMLRNPRLASVQNLYDDGGSEIIAKEKEVSQKAWSEKSWKERFGF